MKNKIFTISLISLIALGLIIPNVNLGQLKNLKNPRNQTLAVETEPIQGSSLELLQQFLTRQLQEENQDIDLSLFDSFINSLQAERAPDGTIHFKPSESKTFLSSLSSNGDVEAPQLLEFDFTPKTIDTSHASQIVTFTFRITDNSSGFWYATWDVSSPSGQQMRVGLIREEYRISGDALDGVYQRTIEFPQYGEEGTWYVRNMFLSDETFNWEWFSEQGLINLGFPTKLEVISAPEDKIPPQIQEFSFSPTRIDTREGPQTVTFTLRTTDDLSGVDSGMWDIYSPSGPQMEVGWIDQRNRISGDALDGIYQDTIEFPQYSKEGTWYVDMLFLADKVSNVSAFFEQDLIDLGFPTKLVNVEETVPTYNIAVILAEPSDVPHEDFTPSGKPCKLDQFQSETYPEYNKKYYEHLAFCVADYHKENSFETINLSFTIYDNDEEWFRTNRNEEDYIEKEDEFVIDAINLATNTGIDLSDEDMVIVVHSGTSLQREKDKLATRTWTLSEQPLGYLPYKIIVAEDDLVGGWAHEIGHIIGALITPQNTITPDIYKMGNVGKWDIMADGSWNDGDRNPPYMSSYTKEFLQWLNYDIYSKSAYGEYWINSLETSELGDYVFRYNLSNDTNDISPKYYILEARNRNLKTWDSSLPEEKALVLYYVNTKGYQEYGYTNGVMNNQYRKIKIPFFHGILTPDGESHLDLAHLVYISALSDEQTFDTYRIKSKIEKIDYNFFEERFRGAILEPLSQFYQKIIKYISPRSPKLLSFSHSIESPRHESDKAENISLKTQLSLAGYQLESILKFLRIPDEPPTSPGELVARYSPQVRMKMAIIRIVEILIFIFLVNFLLVWLNKKIIFRWKSGKGKMIIKLLIKIIWVISIIIFVISLYLLIVIATREAGAVANDSEGIFTPPLQAITMPDLDLHLYCDDGRHIGMNYETGEYEIQIEGVIVSGDNQDMPEWIFIPPDVVNCHFTVSSYDNQKFLEENPEIAQEMEDTTDSYEVYARYIDPETDIYTSAIIPEDIDSGVELGYQISGSQDDIIIEPEIEEISASVEIKPETLNLTSQGVLTAFVQLPEEYNVADIDVDTVECEGAETVKSNITGNNTLIVKFNRQDLTDVSVGDEVEITITGELIDGTKFKGTDVIRMIEKGKKK